MRPMREVQRRNLVNRARTAAQKKAAVQIHGLLDRRFKALKRELRRANLRKRLDRNLRETGTLFKDGGGTGQTWDAWIASFAPELKDVLSIVVVDVYAAESKYWLSRRLRPNPVDPQQVITSYEARAGRQISSIGQTTRDGTLQTITDWYNTDASLPELIDSLGFWFGESRSEMIARTESTYITSEVARNLYDQFGIGYFNVDLANERGPWPCDDCVEQAEANPHPIGDQMPPFHVDCQCGTTPATPDGGELIYGADDDV